jgi:hypothetical protein
MRMMPEYRPRRPLKDDGTLVGYMESDLDYLRNNYELAVTLLDEYGEKQKTGVDPKDEFLRKLKALMKEYRASICFSVGSGSDTHGLYEEAMIISHQPDPKKFKEEEWLEVYGWCLTETDILKELG